MTMLDIHKIINISETYENGNITEFKKEINKLSKYEIVLLIDEMTQQEPLDRVLNTMQKYLEVDSK